MILKLQEKLINQETFKRIFKQANENKQKSTENEKQGVC